MNCKCGKGAASIQDGRCGFCRRRLLSAAQRRKGRIRGDTCTFEQYQKVKYPSQPEGEPYERRTNRTNERGR